MHVFAEIHSTFNGKYCAKLLLWLDEGGWFVVGFVVVLCSECLPHCYVWCVAEWRWFVLDDDFYTIPCVCINA